MNIMFRNAVDFLFFLTGKATSTIKKKTKKPFLWISLWVRRDPAYLLCSLFTLKQNTDISYEANTACVCMVEEDLGGCLKCAKQVK